MERSYLGIRHYDPTLLLDITSQLNKVEINTDIYERGGNYFIIIIDNIPELIKSRKLYYLLRLDFDLFLNNNIQLEYVILNSNINIDNVYSFEDFRWNFPLVDHVVSIDEITIFLTNGMSKVKFSNDSLILKRGMSEIILNSNVDIGNLITYIKIHSPNKLKDIKGIRQLTLLRFFGDDVVKILNKIDQLV